MPIISRPSAPRTATRQGGRSRLERIAKAGVTFAIIGVLTLPLFACGTSGPVAAKVNGDEITVAVLDAEMSKLKLQSPSLFEASSGMSEDQIRSEMLSELINQKLLEQEAAKRDIKVTDEDLDAEMSSYADAYGGQEEFEAILSQSGMTIESARELVRWEILRNAILEQEVSESDITDDDIAAYYEANPESFQYEAAKRASHILFNEEDEALAKDVLERARNGEDFAALATEYSQDEGSAATGGDLGWPTVDYVPEFEASVASLKVGEISDLVKTEFGWHIITVTDAREAGTQSLEEATDTIRQDLLSERRQAAYQELLDSLREAAKIEIVDPKVLAANAASKNAE